MTEPAPDSPRLARAGRLGLVLLSVAAVASALWVIGGPLSGRAEARDGARLDDLRRLVDFVRCVAAADGGALPEALAPDDRCLSEPPLSDPQSGVPYAYARTSARGFSLCAAFERPDLVTPESWAGQILDPATGCINATLEAP